MKKLVSLVCLCLFAVAGWAQSKNDGTEVIDYREVDGKIIIELVVNGVIADFALDLGGHTAILPEYVEKFKLNTEDKARTQLKTFKNRDVKVAQTLKVDNISFGNSAFGNGIAICVLEDEPYLRKLGVAGVVGASLFKNIVLTIDSKRKKITMSRPYRPNYMKLDRRANIENRDGFFYCTAQLDGVSFPLLLDTWSDGMLTLNAADFAKLSGSAANGCKTSVGLGATDQACAGKTVKNMGFVKETFADVTAVENKTLPVSVLGNGILEKGLLSIDITRLKIYFQPFDLVEVKDEVFVEEVKVEPGKLNPINRDYFLKHIFDYRKGGEFIYKGDKPVVIDFWATWCGPCMRLIPEMEKLAAKYKDKVIFLKVNADKEKELCGMYNITALPTIFFIPVGGQPIIEIGDQPAKFQQIIEEKLLKK